MKRRSLTTKERLRLFMLHNGACHLCGGKVDGVREKWDVEHVIPLAMGGEDDDANRKPAHVTCHRGKTKQDMGNIARAKRREARHMGTHRPRAVIPGSKLSRWKKKLDGTVVERT